jgi:Uma2 family endonuclease
MIPFRLRDGLRRGRQSRLLILLPLEGRCEPRDPAAYRREDKFEILDEGGTWRFSADASFGIREPSVIDAVRLTAQVFREPAAEACTTTPHARCDRLAEFEKQRACSVANVEAEAMKSAAARVTSAAEGLPRRRFTVAEVEAMVAAGVMEEDERVELIGGELVPMSPKEIRHEVVKIALLRRWYRVAPDDLDLAPETTFRLSEDTYLEPDVVVYPRATGLRRLTGANALLVVEIADSSLRYDMGRKAALYASFGVRELWVIEAVRLTIRVFREPAADGYRDALDFGASVELTPVYAPKIFALRLEELELE